MRLVYFISIVVGALIAPWWLLVPVFALYAFHTAAYELIVLGILLDAYFGYALPWQVLYTAMAAVSVAGAHFIRPRVTFFERES